MLLLKQMWTTAPLFGWTEIKLIWKTLKMYKSELSEWFLMIIPQVIRSFLNNINMYTRNKMEEATDNWGLQGNP